MFRILFLLFIVVPIIEIALLMQVGSLIGAWPTVSIVIITAWLGANNVKAQGLTTIQNVQYKMAQGEVPSQEIVVGLLLLVAGILLVTPGFATDALGLSLLIPQVRSSLVKHVKKHMVMQAESTTAFTHANSANQPFEPAEQAKPFEQVTKHNRQGNTIDGEYERKD